MGFIFNFAIAFFVIIMTISIPLFSLSCLIVGIVMVVRSVKGNGSLAFHGKVRQGIVLSIVGMFGMILFMLLFVPPALSAHRRMNDNRCTDNLKTILILTQVYAQENNNCFPLLGDSRNMLEDELARPTKGLECPHGPYRFFVDGQSIAAIKNPSSSIMAACPSPHYNGRVNVLFADGVVKSIELSRVERAIQQATPGEMPVLE